jgi:hypothetical protein
MSTPAWTKMQTYSSGVGVVEETQGKSGNHTNLDIAVAADERSKTHENNSPDSLDSIHVHPG